MSDLIPTPTPPGGGEFLFYQSEDSRIRLQVRLEAESVWLTQAQLSELFQRERSFITKHIRNIFEDDELVEQAVCANYARTASDGKTHQIAEVQALNRQPMYMRDWLARMDDFLRLGGRNILTHAVKISHEQAVQKADLEFEKHHRAQLDLPSQVEQDFDAAVKELKNLPAPGRKKKKP